MSDEVDIDVRGGLVAALHNMLSWAADLCFCAIVGHPHLSVTGTLSHLANIWLFWGWFVGAGTFGVESSWADQGSSVLVGLVTRPTAAVMRVNHENLVLSALDFTPLELGIWYHLSIFDQAEETRMTLMGDPELAIASALAKGVVCIAASDRAGRRTTGGGSSGSSGSVGRFIRRWCLT